jgi:two-component system, response regulator PdtaR
MICAEECISRIDARWPLVCFAVAGEQGGPAPAPRARILVVEDDYFAGLQSEEGLVTAGFDVVGIATSAHEAIDIATRELPDLIVMDIRLAHNGDGIETAVALYLRWGLRSIFATAHSDQGTRDRAAAARPVGWLAKPFTSDALVNAVRSALASMDSDKRRE